MNEDMKQAMTDSMNIMFENEQMKRLMRMQFAMQLIAHTPTMTAEKALTKVDEVMAIA